MILKIDNRSKLIKVTYKSPAGWATVEKYISDDLASFVVRTINPESQGLKKQNMKIPNSKNRKIAHGFLSSLSSFRNKIPNISNQSATLFASKCFIKSNTATKQPQRGGTCFASKKQGN